MTSPDELVDNDAVLKIWAGLKLSVDTLCEKIDRANKLEQRRLSLLPVNIPIGRMSNPAGATDIQDFGGPQPGREWIIRLLSAFASPLGANAAVVTWYIGQNMPGPAAGQLPGSMAVWQFPSVPGFQSFTSDIFKVRSGEHVLAGLTGVPGSSFIHLKCIVNDQPTFAQNIPVAVE